MRKRRYSSPVSGLMAALLVLGSSLSASSADRHGKRPHAADVSRPQSLDPFRGALVFYGNYCGVGNRGPGMPPIDRLDAACMRHDACWPDTGLPACSCNRKLQQEANAASMDPSLPLSTQSLAAIIAFDIALVPCESKVAPTTSRPQGRPSRRASR